MTYTLRQPGEFSQLIRKSRFLAHAVPISSEAEALAVWERLSDPAATHNCWAWRLGARARFNDDGEPSGTAGKPLLWQLESRELDGVMLLVTRWYGGTKLGIGGLARAYGGTAGACLDLCERVEKQVLKRYQLTADFSWTDTVYHLLAQYQAEKLDERYIEQGLQLQFAVSEGNSQDLYTAIMNSTSGQASIRRLHS